MTRDVYRHYKVGTSFPSDLMGPMPTSGPGAAPAPNLFRIRPLLPPAGNEWVVLNENVDLATAYFDTASLAGAPVGGPPWPDDLAAGRYELTLELFDTAGTLVDWTAKGIDLRITDQDAPFGTGTVTTSAAPAYNRILVGGNTMGFRMVRARGQQPLRRRHSSGRRDRHARSGLRVSQLQFAVGHRGAVLHRPASERLRGLLVRHHARARPGHPGGVDFGNGG